jgi:hypothetical protein
MTGARSTPQMKKAGRAIRPSEVFSQQKTRWARHAGFGFQSSSG